MHVFPFVLFGQSVLAAAVCATGVLQQNGGKYEADSSFGETEPDVTLRRPIT